MIDVNSPCITPHYHNLLSHQKHQEHDDRKKPSTYLRRSKRRKVSSSSAAAAAAELALHDVNNDIILQLEKIVTAHKRSIITRHSLVSQDTEKVLVKIQSEAIYQQVIFHHRMAEALTKEILILSKRR